LLVDERWVCCR